MNTAINKVNVNGKDLQSTFESFINDEKRAKQDQEILDLLTA